tara:strand:+ start:81331 stop:81852 length:522 start_codon:yes stop_codon:yes gene_type:complete
MKKLLQLLALSSVMFTSIAFASAENANERHANKDELVGAWRVVGFLSGSFGKHYPDSHYLAPSQIYGFYPDGHVRSLVSDKAKSYTQNLEELEAHFTNKPATLHYNFINDSHIAITIDEKQEIGTVWRAHISVEDGNLEGIPFKSGDLIMGMTPKKDDPEQKMRYIRVLRKNQ